MKINHYFINCENDIFVQLDDIYFKNNFKKMNGRLIVDIYLKQNFEKNILIFDNLIINIVNDMFPLWFNKEIEMSDLLEYYIPTIKDYYENNEMKGQDDVASDLFSYTSSEENSEENNSCEEDEHTDNTSELAITCEVPYFYEENFLDIMVFDSSNILWVNLWINIELMGNDGICVIKLSGLKIEKNKFYSVWELVQLKLCNK